MSRQIDDMTPQEIEVLHLKGMLGRGWEIYDKGQHCQEWDTQRERDRDLEHESREAEAQREEKANQ